MKQVSTGRIAAAVAISSAAAFSASLPQSAHAQDASTAANSATEADSSGTAESLTEVLVTGFRQSLRESLDYKRESNSIVDSVFAEDVAKFPESNLAEALQRIPGITIERENGEGRTITVRGLGGDFVRTRLNGIETVASSGNNEGQSNINRTRGFDYNVFASDLFQRLTVRKSAEATVDEGSLGSTVDIDTGSPLSYDKPLTLSFAAQDTFYDNGDHHNPRLSGLFATKMLDDTLGFMVSGAYQKRETGLSFYDRNPGQFEVNYRGSDLAGPVRNGTGSAATPVCITSGAPTVSATVNRSPHNCFWGFATAAPATTSPAPSGVGGTAYGIDANSLMFGTNPAAAALLDANPGATVPALTSIQQQELNQERLGLTTAFEWRPTDRTGLRIDGLYAKFDVENDSHILGSFGLNRHFDTARAEIGLTNNSTGLRPWSAANFNYFADRRAAYGNRCTASATQDCTGTLGNPAVAALPTTQYWNGSAYVSVPAVLNSNVWSTNPYNLDTYDYYNNPNSVGYNAAAALADRRGILSYDEIVGKEHIAVQDVHINDAGQIDYFVMNRVDWLTNDAYAENRSRYHQVDLILDHEFSDSFTAQLVYGQSRNRLNIDGGRTDIFALDKDGFVFDERGGGSIPVWDPGFDAADINEWGPDIVKGYSGITRYVRESQNDHQTYRLDLRWKASDAFQVPFGISMRSYEFQAEQSNRGTSVISTIAELNRFGAQQNRPEYANLTLADMGSVVHFGEGLDLPPGVPTSWWSPDRKKWEEIYGYNCDCINEFVDWRLQNETGNVLNVQEDDLAAYLQVDYDLNLFDRPLRGNLGVRVAQTEVTSRSLGTTGAFNGVELEGSHKYTDWLPSINIAYEPTDKLIIRLAASKTIARPQLGNLGPGVTSLNMPTAPEVGTAVPRVTLGNPKLNPFRSQNYDLNAEWYFNEDSLVSVALFYKALDNYPRQQTFEVRLNEFAPPELYDSIRNGLTLSPVQAAYMDGANVWAVTSSVDSPGGYVRGLELQYQQVFSFLPQPFNTLGVQANFTKLQSKLAFLSQQGTLERAPWPFASPYSVNTTLFYERGPFEARISYSWRDRFATVFPQSIGLCPPGLDTDPTTGGVCTSPYNDFSGTESAEYVDFKTSYQFSDNFQVDLAIQDVLGETESQWVYAPVSAVRKYSAGAGRIMTLGFRFNY